MKYKQIPGKAIKTIGKLKKSESPTISIITPFYNGEKTLMQTANSIFSQTYPFFEWIIINDGSTSDNSKKALENLAKLDNRVKVLNKENGGPSQARDYGIKRTNPTTKYIYFIDCDDIIENNMLEMMYWTLETHPEASFVYPSIINFGAYKYYWEPYLTLEEELVNNVLCINTMVKKEDLLEVGCFGIKEKAMYEDWNLWLKLLAKEKIPIRINPQSFWYRTSTTGELSRAKSNNAKAIKLIRETAKTVKNDVDIIQYPRMSSDNTIITSEKMILPSYEKEKSILYIINNTAANYNNISNYEIIKRLSKNKYSISVVAIEPFRNEMRQDIQEYADEFFDLSNFLDYKDYPLFINYLIHSRKIENLIISDWVFGYSLIPSIKQHNPQVKIHAYLNDAENHIIDSFKPYLSSIITSNKLIVEHEKSFENLTYIEKPKHKRNHKSNIKPITELRKKYNLPENKKIISWIDNISYEARAQVFVELAKKILNKRNDVFFLMSGDGQLEKEIRLKVEKYKLKDKFTIIEEQENQEEIFELSDIIIKCAGEEGASISNYVALTHGKPVISNEINNANEYLDSECCEIVEHMDTKSQSDYACYADRFLEKTNKVLNEYDKYRENASSFATINDTFYNNMVGKIIDNFKGENHKIDSLHCGDQLYVYYTMQLKQQFRESYLKYYKEVHHLIPRETIDKSKFAILKRKIRGFSLKNNIENEMHYIFIKISFLEKAIKGFVQFIKNSIIFTIYLIPIFVAFLKCALKLIYRWIIELKNKVIY